jgi:excisionase family DNA binding protein
MSAEPTRSALDPLMSITELADYLGVPVKTIYEWRQNGRGPVGIRMGRHLKFAVSDVREWVQERREESGRQSSSR